jgi:hypothetical protein
MLYRSNSFEGSLRNYNSPKGPVVQNKHHRENCHHNCSKMYDKHERIIHYATGDDEIKGTGAPGDTQPQ